MKRLTRVLSVTAALFGISAFSPVLMPRIVVFTTVALAAVWRLVGRVRAAL